MRTQISDYELITFFNNLKEIIQAQKELNHVLAKRITNLENRLEKLEDVILSVYTDDIVILTRRKRGIKKLLLELQS